MCMVLLEFVGESIEGIRCLASLSKTPPLRFPLPRGTQRKTQIVGYGKGDEDYASLYC